VRDHRADYERRGARVLGVSPDPVKKVAGFVEKQGLDFTLLADEDHAVCETYGVWVEKSMYGKTYWGASRSTVVIDPDGVVAEVFPKVKPAEHDAKVPAALDALQGATA
jgi:peroxiredoxin Q/BCP